MRPLLLLLLLASCATRPEPPPPPDDTPWLALELPQQVRSSVPLAAFRGRVAGAEFAGADVVLVIDLTNTMLAASGVDADGDGKLGEDRPWALEHAPTQVRWERPAHTWTSDWDDAIVSVELASARLLVEALAERHCRIGIVTFTSRPRVLAELGPADAALRALEGLRVRVDRSGTEPKLALRRAGRLLDAAPRERGPGRRPVVVFLSDGAETNRAQQQIRSEAERVAAELASRGVAVHALGFGSDEAEAPEFMSRLAGFGRGRYLHVARAGEVLALLDPPLPIAALPVENRTRPDAPARAVRHFADGSFDGFVPLVPGENHIALEVVLEDGRRVRAERSVRYEPLAQPSPEDSELLRALRDRSAETSLAGESRTGVSRRRTSLELRAEPPRPAGSSGESP